MTSTPYASLNAAGLETPALNTDREIWRERPGDFYADSIHVTEAGSIGINCGGTVFTMPVREWHAMALTASKEPETGDLRECLRQAMLSQTRTDGRDTFDDGFANGLAFAIGQIDARAALSHTGKEPVGIKALVWEQPENKTTWFADTLISRYRICAYEAGDFAWSAEGMPGVSGGADSLDEAQAAAQSNFDAAIRSALTHPDEAVPQPLPAGERATTEALRHISRIAQDRTEHANHRIDAIVEIAGGALEAAPSTGEAVPQEAVALVDKIGDLIEPLLSAERKGAFIGLHQVRAIKEVSQKIAALVAAPPAKTAGVVEALRKIADLRYAEDVDADDALDEALNIADAALSAALQASTGGAETGMDPATIEACAKIVQEIVQKYATLSEAEVTDPLEWDDGYGANIMYDMIGATVNGILESIRALAASPDKEGKR